MELISIEELVPRDHPLRAIEESIDFSFIKRDLLHEINQDRIAHGKKPIEDEYEEYDEDDLDEPHSKNDTHRDEHNNKHKP
ncbi:hypothetical protein JT739_06470 [Tepidanaerobacter sp. GT38]|jgi:hypothetical protein|uniref:hypothetical protein n=1 Tax=Tepidanaerobacter sp. GT38 TaxID=2722793 RepID=UPI001F1B55AF|nr:hypothetical protein [Tepidanaerobacter sp. GT38]MCG1012247.1 hypothetical protein [Tepidanaerobacter sp. GT38]